MNVPYSLIGKLGMASRQAVHASGDARRWLDCRIRRFITPVGKHHSFRINSLRKKLIKSSNTYLNWIKSDLDNMPAIKHKFSPGRQIKWNPKHLASFLGTKYISNDTIYTVFERYIKECVSCAVKLLFGKSRLKYFRIKQLLDKEWLPRWVNKLTGSLFIRMNPKFCSGGYDT